MMGIVVGAVNGVGSFAFTSRERDVITKRIMYEYLVSDVLAAAPDGPASV
jgi:hypothetical protein